ncbi:MAG: hypothetical protein GY861_05410 [bacterium]|nr:hypothetical protein [bacterium]
MGKEENFGDKASTNGLKQNPQNINKKGRPLKIYTILQKLGYGADDTKAAFGELAYYTVEQLDEVIEKPDTPAIVVIVAKAFKNAMNDGTWYKVREIIEHTIGKPKQEVDQNVKYEEPLIINWSKKKDKKK